MKRYSLFRFLKATSCLIGKIKPFCEIDELTGIYNLYALKSDLKKDSAYAIALVNIDGFSTVNNGYGIDAGDTLLKGFCATLKKNIPIDAVLYRCYGDEFAILFPSADVNEAKNFAEQLEGYLFFSSIDIGGIELKVAATIGIGVGSGDNLLKNASIALMEARLSKKSYMIYEGESPLEKKIQRIFYWQTKLKEALTEGYLIPFYQPLLNNKSGKIDKFESLIRLRYDGDIISPADFLDAAKEGGMLSSVTKIIISESFREFAKNDYSFSVNITEQDLLNKKFIDFLQKKLALNNIEPHRVYFELLEGISTDVANSSLETLKEIKRMGCKLSVDDFGTEHSNFRRLLELEVDLIKIDGSFIKNLDKCETSQKIVRSIIGFAKSIGSQTAAEFVHSEKIQTIVKEMGIDYSQGYYIGIPTIKPQIIHDEAFD